MSPTLDRRHAIASLAGMGLAGIASARTLSAQATPEVEGLPPVSESTDGPFIVVSATGQASAAADRAIGQLIVRSQFGPPMPVDLKSEAPIDPPATPPAVPADVLEMLVTALIEAGVDESRILTTDPNVAGGTSFFGPGAAVIVFEVVGEGIKTLGDLLGTLTTIALEAGLIYDPPGAMYLSDGCQDLRRQAYVDAVEVGRQEATLIADALGVGLGELMRAVKQSVSFGPAAYGMIPSDSCDHLVDLESALRTYLPPFDPSLPSEFIVYAMIELSFSFA